MPCDVCPVEAGLACLGEIHPYACDDIRRGRPGRAAQLVALADPVPASDPDPDRLDHRTAMRAELCPHGAGACGCGESPRLCGHPDHPAEVWRRTCLRCVVLAEWEASIGIIE